MKMREVIAMCQKEGAKVLNMQTRPARDARGKLGESKSRKRAAVIEKFSSKRHMLVKTTDVLAVS